MLQRSTEAYQKDGLMTEERKGESQIDFDNYMKIMEQWSIHEMDDTIVKRDAFWHWGFRCKAVASYSKRLKEANILNKHGYINLKIWI